MELQVVQNLIYNIRGVQVMIDRDLAMLYGVTTGALNQAVKRNFKRFPDDFMFQLTEAEFLSLKSQFAASSLISQFVISNRGGIRKLPYVFTEQGVAMLSGLLKSDVAINANIAIMRAFVSVRSYIAGLSTLTAELAEIRNKIELLERADEDTLEDVNDLSEFTRKEIDNLYAAFAALAANPPKIEKPRAVIKGYAGY